MEQTTNKERRRFLGWLSGAGMFAGLTAGYGSFATMIARYIYPSNGRQKSWLFVAPIHEVGRGETLLFRTPSGEIVAIIRKGDAADSESFIALSSTCPHLGCQVHWQPAQDRFFCPCHNGVFSPDGTSTEGPPAQAGQNLPRYPLKEQRGLLYMEVPTEQLAEDSGEVIKRIAPADVVTRRA